MSSDPTPPDPDTLTADPQTGGTGGAESATGGLGEHPVVEGLLSTEPSGEAETPTELALRGTKKFLRGALGAGVTSGQTAAEDFVRATIGYYRQQSGAQTSAGPQTVKDELAGDIDRQTGEPVNDPQDSPYNPDNQA